MTTISDGTTTLTPVLWMDYESTRQAGTRTHTLVSGKQSITLAPAGPRRVRVALLFDDEAASIACETMHAGTSVITITEDGRPTHSMQYVVMGDIRRELDKETAAVWIVSAEVQEIGAP